MITKENYREYPAINYSKLAALDRHPKASITDDSYSDALRIGSAVDVLLTSPADYSKKFYVFDKVKPTAQMGIFVDEYLKCKDTKIAYEKLKEQNGGKLQTSYEKFCERFKIEAKDYIDAIELSEGKIIMTKEENTLCQLLASGFLTNPFTGIYFREAPGIEIFYQFPLVRNLYVLGSPFPVKALLDLVVIDHNKKEIYPIDIKTTSDSVYAFNKSVWKWSYHLQAALYYDVLEDYAKVVYKGYTIKPFRFLVNSSLSPNFPIIYDASKIMNLGRNGGYLQNSNRKIKGYKTLILELTWHEESGLYEYKKEVYDNNGIIFIDA